MRFRSKVEESKEAINVDNNSIIADKNSINVGNNSSTTIPQAVLDVYQIEIRPGLSDVEAERLADDVARYGEAVAIKAIQRAAIRSCYHKIKRRSVMKFLCPGNTG